MLRGLRKIAWATAAVFTLATVRAGLSFLSYARLRKVLPNPVVSGQDPPHAVLDRCRWALIRGSRVVPAASCLTQALAGQWLLQRLGYDSRVIIGVRPLEQGTFAAHAWLIAGGRTVVGGDAEDLAAFSELTELGTSS